MKTFAICAIGTIVIVFGLIIKMIWDEFPIDDNPNKEDV